MQLTGGNERCLAPSLAGITLIRFYGFDLRFPPFGGKHPGETLKFCCKTREDFFKIL